MIMGNVKILVQKISEQAKMPIYAHSGDSGADLYSTIDYTLKPQERVIVPTGLKISMPPGYEAQVRPKSGLALHHGITVLNTPGTVDASYRGEIGVILINHDAQKEYQIRKGEKIAQIVFVKVEKAIFEEVLELDLTSRGAGGFGSTGKK